MDKQIQLKFIRSIGIINKNIVLIAVLSALPLMTLPFATRGNPAYGLLVVQFLAILLIAPLIYGRFYEGVRGDTKSGWWGLFTQHWWNYTLVSFILALPYAALFIFGISNMAAANAILAAVIEIFTLYVMPLVFITRQRIPAIASGISCLLDNLQYSIPLIVIALILSCISPLMHSYILKPLQGSALYTANFLWYLIMYYFDVIVFTTATMILLEDKKFQYLVPVSIREDA